MNSQLKRLLVHLQSQLDTSLQNESQQRFINALTWQPVDRLPLVCNYPLPENFPFLPYPLNEIYSDPEKMLYNELVYAFEKSLCLQGQLQDDMPWTIRANFGTGIVASLLGGRIEQVENNTPWVRSFTSLDECNFILAHDPQEHTRGWGTQVCQFYSYCNEVLSEYPRLKSHIKLVLPDLQGPFDTAEQLCGSDIFLYMYQRPEWSHSILEVISKTQVDFAQNLLPLLNDGPKGYAHQHCVMIRGNILIRNDTSILVSPQMYSEQIAGHDEYVLRQMKGGAIHSCGRLQDHVEAFLSLPSLQCIDVGQSWLNNIDEVYCKVSEKRVALTRVCVTEQDLLNGEIKRRFPTGVVLNYYAPSFSEAQQVIKQYRKTNN